MTAPMIQPPAQPRGKHTFRTAAIIALVCLVVAAIVVGIVRSASGGLDGPSNDGAATTSSSGSPSSSPSSTPPTTPTSPSAPPPGPSEELLAALSVPGTVPACSAYATATFPVVAGSDVLAPKLGFEQPDRYSTFSPSVAPQGTTAAELVRSSQAAVCADPNQGWQAGNLLFNMRLGNGPTVGSLEGNEFLSVSNTEDSRDLVESALPFYGKNVSKLSVTEQSAASEAWNTYELYASKVNWLLERLHQVGSVAHPQSLINFRLLDAGMSAGLNVVAPAPTQENLRAFVLAVTEKGVSCEFARIGFNLLDGRWEKFTPQGCTIPKLPPKVTPPPRTTGPNVVQTTVTPPATTRTTPSKTTPTTPPSTTPSTRTTTSTTRTTTTTTTTTTSRTPCPPGYNGKWWPNCVKAAVVTNGGTSSTVIPAPPSTAQGPNPSPIPVTRTSTLPNGSTTTSVQPTSSQCYYEADGSPAPGPGPGIRCS